MSFSAIRGQAGAVRILKAYIASGRLSGGYIFSGPEGIGKKLAARTLAKAVNCQSAAGDSCDKCASCLKIESNSHPDVHFIEAGDSDIKIECIRQLQKDFSLRPYEAKCKVYIVDNAHNLTAEASNALLKILEEPPAGSLIILITDKLPLLFKTVISRCKNIKFPALTRHELKEILADEHALSDADAHFLAYFCEGRLGLALSLKDTGIVSEKNSVIDRFCLSSRYGPDNFSVNNKSEVRRYLNIVAGWFRDMYIVKTGLPYSQIINFDRKDDLLKAMNRFTFFDLGEILDSITYYALCLEQNINPKLILHNLKAQLWKR